MIESDLKMSLGAEKVLLMPSSFQFHDFVTQVGEITIAGQIVQMEDCFFMWIGDENKPIMDDLSFAFPSKDESQSVATKLMGPVADTISNNLAKRLSKKFGKPVYLSFNIQVDNLSLPEIEKSVHEELKKCSDLTSF